MDTISTTASNRNSLAEISMRIAKRISDAVPLDGRIIKINQERLIVNLGSKDGISKNHTLEAVRSGEDNIKLKVTFVDEYISEVLPESFGWSKNLSLRDKVIVTGIKKNDIEIEKK